MTDEQLMRLKLAVELQMTQAYGVEMDKIPNAVIWQHPATGDLQIIHNFQEDRAAAEFVTAAGLTILSCKPNSAQDDRDRPPRRFDS